MTTTTQKNKPNVFSFHRKVFLTALIALFTLSMVSCQKEALIPVVPANKNQVPANPNVKHVSINQLTAIGATNGLKSTEFDIDGDGVNDFMTVINKTEESCKIYLLGLGTNRITTRSFSNFFITPYNEHSIITSNSVYWNMVGNIYERNSSHEAGGAENIEHFTGIKLNKNGKTFYGWLRFKYDVFAGAANGATITIVDAAFEQTEGFAIEIVNPN